MTTHAKISYAKSGLRILGYVMLLQDTFLAVIVLVLSEVLGIFEEIGH